MRLMPSRGPPLSASDPTPAAWPPPPLHAARCRQAPDRRLQALGIRATAWWTLRRKYDIFSKPLTQAGSAAPRSARSSASSTMLRTISARHRTARQRQGRESEAMLQRWRRSKRRARHRLTCGLVTASSRHRVAAQSRRTLKPRPVGHTLPACLYLGMLTASEGCKMHLPVACRIAHAGMGVVRSTRFALVADVPRQECGAINDGLFQPKGNLSVDTESAARV